MALTGLLNELRELSFAIESTPGTAETHPGDGSISKFLITNSSVGTPFPMYQRDIQDGNFSRLTKLVGVLPVEFTFDIEARASAAAGTADAWGDLFQACGFSETNTASTSDVYAPTSDRSVMETATIWLYRDGHRISAKGCAGDVSIVQTLGEPAIWRFKFMGVWNGVADDALNTITHETAVPSVFLGVGLTWDSVALKFASMSIDLNNRVSPRNSANEPEGICHYHVTGRDPKGKIDPELNLVATYDWYDVKLRQAAEFAVTWSNGSKLAYSIPKCQIMAIGDASRDDMATLDVEFALNQNSGDDELTITKT